jgi:hypothetical protein
MDPMQPHTNTTVTHSFSILVSHTFPASYILYSINEQKHSTYVRVQIEPLVQWAKQPIEHLHNIHAMVGGNWGEGKGGKKLLEPCAMKRQGKEKQENES